MNKKLRLLAVLAHPDDESLGFGGTLAKYAAEGFGTYLVTATRGERGRFGSPGSSGDPREVGRTIATHIRRIRPHVIVTFGPEEGYGHPDHIAISQFTTAAAICAADIRFEIDDVAPVDLRPPHRAAKLHYMAWRKNKWDAY
jgi:LmbE family N-acetylglucosaminyl deacetylase